MPYFEIDIKLKCMWVTLIVKVSRVHPKVKGGFYSLLGRDFSIFIPVNLFKADTNVDTKPFSIQLYKLLLQ